ncbi:MAG: hypothetical protein KKC68_05705 [Candidatus Thermoplasmatota archaeon]|nr:hypothetical protein [Candidatus Thermoplasmatota archaeon]MBU1941251.1 hypothetical protein [Candidatus Thermoplasmatota archaeon]
MHRNIKSLFIIGIITIPLLGASTIATAWEDCPIGILEDYYPGLCRRLIDTNNDAICDRSQLELTAIQNQGSITNTITSEIAGVPVLQNSSIINLIISFILVITGLILTRILTKRNFISKTKERLLWNVLLLIFFLPSAITGVIIILTSSFPNLRDIGVLIIDLHGITSYYFMWILGYHTIVHIRYYSKGIKSLTKKKL